MFPVVIVRSSEMDKLKVEISRLEAQNQRLKRRLEAAIEEVALLKTEISRLRQGKVDSKSPVPKQETEAAIMIGSKEVK